MRQIIAALCAGVVFGIGLVVSQMANPAKVLGFLDLFGAWDPSLAFVMAGAILVALPGYKLLRARSAPLFAEQFDWPTMRAVDVRLLSGAAVFGVGWGLVGFCPGPAIAALGFGGGKVALFVIGMVVGVAIYRLVAAKPLTTLGQEN
jgi:uncharacterized protein